MRRITTAGLAFAVAAATLIVLAPASTAQTAPTFDPTGVERTISLDYGAGPTIVPDKGRLNLVATVCETDTHVTLFEGIVTLKPVFDSRGREVAHDKKHSPIFQVAMSHELANPAAVHERRPLNNSWIDLQYGGEMVFPWFFSNGPTSIPKARAPKLFGEWQHPGDATKKRWAINLTGSTPNATSVDDGPCQISQPPQSTAYTMTGNLYLVPFTAPAEAGSPLSGELVICEATNGVGDLEPTWSVIQAEYIQLRAAVDGNWQVHLAHMLGFNPIGSSRPPGANDPLWLDRQASVNARGGQQVVFQNPRTFTGWGEFAVEITGSTNYTVDPFEFGTLNRWSPTGTCTVTYQAMSIGVTERCVKPEGTGYANHPRDICLEVFTLMNANGTGGRILKVEVEHKGNYEALNIETIVQNGISGTMAYWGYTMPALGHKDFYFDRNRLFDLNDPRSIPIVSTKWAVGAAIYNSAAPWGKGYWSTWPDSYFTTGRFEIAHY